MSGLGGSSNLGTATFYITGNAAGASNAAQQANASLATLEQAVSHNWWGVQNLGLAFAALPAAVVGGIGATVKAAGDLEVAFTNIARTAGISINSEMFGGLKAQLLDIGKIRATPTITILGIAESAGALGVATDDIAAFTQTVVDLVSTTNVTAEAGATGLARLAALTGTTAGGYDNLASSIMTTGVETAATESEILSMAQRISGLGAAMGLSAQEIIGWSGAILSAGIKTAEGGTQVSKTFIDIKRAVSQNGADLQGWANIAGQSAADFRKSFESDASAGLLSVVTGLGNIVAQGGNFVSYLDTVGVKEQRQVKLLLQLAAAQANNANEHAKASFILGVAAKGYQNLERYQSAVEARNATFNARLQELQNTLQQTGAAIGANFLGPLKLVVETIQTFALGVGVMPGPIKAVTASLVGLMVVASALGAIFFLIGPRVIIAWGALQKIRDTALQAASGVGVLAGAQGRAASQGGLFNVTLAKQNQKLIEQRGEAILTANAIAFMSGSHQNGAQLIQQYNAAQGQASRGAQVLSTWIGRLGRAVQLTSALMIGLVAYTYALGQAQQRVEEQQRNAQKANENLTAAMRTEGSAINDRTKSILSSLPAYQKAVSGAHALGVEHQAVNTILGTASPAEYQQFLDAVQHSNIGGTETGNDLIRTVYNMRSVMKNSAGDAGVATNAIQSQTAAEGALADQTGKTTEELNAFRDMQEQIAQATMDLVDAQIAASIADLDLADAEQKLSEAQHKAANQALYTQKAELALVKARLDEQKAARDVAQAELDLARAREKAANDVLDAEGTLADARDGYANDLDKIKDQEKALADLQNNSADQEDKLRSATNKLNEARIRLKKSTMEVSDLEQNLAYLIQQGAGARDIAEAELALAQGRQDVADATDNQLSIEKELKDLQDPVKRAQAIAKAERDLAATRRDAEAKLREIVKDEQALADARTAQANDTAYKEAESALEAARISQIDATLAVTQAELDLQNIRDGSLTREALRAELDYEQALRQTASAHVEVTKQTALMNGETWDAGRAAHALADELGNLNIKTQEAMDKRKEWIAILSKAPNVPAKAKSGSGPDALGATDLTGGDISGDGGFGLPESAVPKAHATFMDALKGIVAGGGSFLLAQGLVAAGKWIAGMIGGVEAGVPTITTAGGALGTAVDEGIAIGAVEGSPIIAEGIGTAVVAGAGEAAGLSALAIVGIIIAALLIAAIVGYLVYHFWPEISSFFARVGKLIGRNVSEWFGDLLGFFRDLPGRIVGFLQDLPGRFGELFGQITGMLLDFITTFGSQILDFFVGLPAQLAYALGYILGTIVRYLFIEPIAAAVNYGPQLIGLVVGFISELPGRIGSAISGIPDMVGQLFSMAGEHMLSPILDFGGQVINWFSNLPGWIWDHVSDLPGQIRDRFWDIANGAWIGFWDAIQQIEQWFLDLPGWIWDHVKDLPGQVAGWFGDIGSSLWGGFHDAVFGSPKTKIEYTLDDIRDAMGMTVANMQQHLMKLNGMNVDPLGKIAESMKSAKVALSTQMASLEVDPWAGASLSPGVYNAGQAVVNNYNESLNLDVATNADPEQIVNEYVWVKRVRSRS